MAKLHKITFYYVDFYDSSNVTLDSITDVVEVMLDGIVTVVSAEESEEFEWHDDIDLNRNNATIEEHEAYLTKRRTDI